MSNIEDGDRVKVDLGVIEGTVNYVNGNGSLDVQVELTPGCKVTIEYVPVDKLTKIEPPLPLNIQANPTRAQLDAMKPGSVLDEVGLHTWVKQEDGNWKGVSDYWTPRDAQTSSFLGGVRLTPRYLP